MMNDQPAREGRVRVTSTRAGYLGRRAGRTFDVSPAEFARMEIEEPGMLKLAPGQGVTAAALRAAAQADVNLAELRDANPGRKVTARTVKRKR